MGRKQQPDTETTIPYYQLRQTVQQGYGRGKMIRRNFWWAVVWGTLVGGVYYFFVTPSLSWPIGMAITIIVEVAIWLLLILGSLLLEQIDYSSREADLVEACIAEIKQRGFDAPSILKALWDSASGAAERMQIRTLLPMAIVAAMIAVPGLSIPDLFKGLIVEIGLMLLLYLVLVSGQANADLVIKNALIEHERRQALNSSAVETDPSPTTSSTKALPIPALVEVAPTHANGTSDHVALN